MYSDIKSVQILVALLKEYGIRRVVCSPGNRNVPIVHSIEQDDFFETYSIVDERSAGFFGIGLIQHYKEPVAICCTSGTAVCNYYSAITEAFYQKLPLLVISADRNPYYLNQDEEQMLPQTDGFQKITKRIVQLPIIKDEMDSYVCMRRINEALLELNHHGCGPVQINIPLEANLAQFNTAELPKVTRIQRYTDKDSWGNAFEKLQKSKILVLYGQSAQLSDKDIEIIELFSKCFDAVIAIDPLANLHCEGTVPTFLLSRIIDAEEFKERLCPDVVITLHSGYMSYIRSHLKSCKGQFVHWTVNEGGQVIDPFMSIEKIFESTAIDFMKKMNRLAKGTMNIHNVYREQWISEISKCKLDNQDIPWSDLYMVRELVRGIPEKSKFHIANSSSVRLAAHFDMNSSVEVFCNRGANGIDGSASSYVGMAYRQKELCYLLIGDLSFFYDMNSLWNRYVSRNLRIVLSNNAGATLFHYTVGMNNVPTLDQNIAAGHNASAKQWAEACGFQYYEVRDTENLRNAIKIMADQTLNVPVFVEVFTDKESDSQILKKFYADLRKKGGFKDKSGLLRKIIRR